MARLDARSAAPRVLVLESEGMMFAQFSPDGRWLAYSATVSGRMEIYVSPMPAADQDGLSARWQVSNNGGSCPRWRGDSRELYYLRPDGMIMAVSVDGTKGEFHALGETPLFQVFQRAQVATFSASNDGQHFLINALGGAEGAPLALVTNWQKTLQTR
jgi:hypothetical protein